MNNLGAFFLRVLFVCLWAATISSESCNEYVCGSVVSKCLITQSCQCKLSDCFCCKDCFNCLGDLYTECCSCLDMCPQQNDTLSALAPRSQIGDFDGIAELFDTLTDDVEDDKWTTFRYPMVGAGIKSSLAMGKQQQQHLGDDIDKEAAIQKMPTAANCTVIFLHTCQTTVKCQQFCESMGASSYRWFHDGCCECIGSNCINYGINESKCLSCPQVDDTDQQEPEDDLDFGNEDMWDYGEEEQNYN